MKILSYRFIILCFLFLSFNALYASDDSKSENDQTTTQDVEQKNKSATNTSEKSKSMPVAKDAVKGDQPATKKDKDNKAKKSKDYKFLQFNLMRSQDARLPYHAEDTTYLEMEFGGRSGFVDLYGYLDVFDIFNDSSDDRHDGDNLFFKIQPRFSLNDILNKDLSVGPIKEWYISTLAEVGDRELFNMYIGPGVDVMVPWFGKVGVNLYARYVRENYGAPNENTWDGYKLSINWFKPFYTFKNGSFISYQGYFDYGFGMDTYDDTRSSYSIEWFNGFYWHYQSFALGYGLKYFGNMTGIKNGSPIPGGGTQDTTGWGQYFDITYVFA
ncbi:outer membrane protein OmpK [Thiotrichales bacterium 19X7-9]|nr:outer membrane protein OmpK [Thiotrichales bacterium 19X7-9]